MCAVKRAWLGFLQDTKASSRIYLAWSVSWHQLLFYFFPHILKSSQNQEVCISGWCPELLEGVGGRSSGGKLSWESSRAVKWGYDGEQEIVNFFLPQFWQFRAFSFLWSLLLSRCHYSWRGREGRVSINGNQWPFQFFILQCWMTIMHFWHCLVQLDWECKCLLQPCLEPLLTETVSRWCISQTHPEHRRCCYCLVAESCLPLCSPMNCRLPGSSVPAMCTSFIKWKVQDLLLKEHTIRCEDKSFCGSDWC